MRKRESRRFSWLLSMKRSASGTEQKIAAKTKDRLKVNARNGKDSGEIKLPPLV